MSKPGGAYLERIVSGLNWKYRPFENLSSKPPVFVSSYDADFQIDGRKLKACVSQTMRSDFTKEEVDEIRGDARALYSGKILSRMAKQKAEARYDLVVFGDGEMVFHRTGKAARGLYLMLEKDEIESGSLARSLGDAMYGVYMRRGCTSPNGSYA
jgi:hypothetical protein